MAKEAAALELVWDLIQGRTEGISKVKYFPQKPAFPEELPYEQPFPRATPESQGISSGQIEGMLRAVKESRGLHMHNVMVLRNGHVIGEAGFYPYRREVWHSVYSMSKSVVSMAVGLLISEEKLSLDTRVVEIFKKDVNLFGMFRQKDLTVRHLLTMTSGSTFNEAGAVAGNDWVKSFFEAFTHHAPGELFEYNSMNTYILSAIVTEVTGETLMEYLRPRLFEPLGITRVFWESCPKGYNKGGWGLFLCVEDMAKLGQLYLDKGKWNGVQIIPAEWVEESVAAKVVPPEDTGFAGYGYQIWSCQREGQFAFNGMLGQNVFVYPDLNMVIVTTAGNDVLFNNNELQEVLERHLPPEGAELSPLPENDLDYRKLLRYEWELAHPVRELPGIQSGGWNRAAKRAKAGRGRGKAFPHESGNWRREAKAAAGQRFLMETVQAGLFPLMGQVFHNNYAEGIREIGFHMENGTFFMDIREGETEKALPIGFSQAEIVTLDLHGEAYLAAIEGCFSRDEDGRRVLTVDIAYLEDAFRRKIKIFFQDESIEVRFGEVPGKEVILNGIQSVTAAIMENPLVKKMRENGNVDLIKLVMESTIEPRVYGNKIDKRKVNLHKNE